MFAIIYSTILLFAAETAHSESAWSRFREFFSEYFGIPGFEIWKFVNLAIFIAIIVYLTRKPISEQFRTKRDAIRADLIRAEEEKKAALARLTSIEARLAQLETEKETILTRAKEESEAERRRLSDQTNAEIKRLREQAEAEVARLAHQAKAELRRYSANESIRLAEQKLRSTIGPADDARLVRASISEIGGLN
jgi:F0F1-type ATP synthase membrane subunit b/b'